MLDMRKIKIAVLAVAAAMSLWSCTKITDEKYSVIENRSLRAWMRNHHPELLENYQEEGAYYVEVLDEGDADSIGSPINSFIDASDKTSGSWIFYKATGRDLAGQVCISRDEQMARMQGTFTKFTHYVPFMRFMGASNTSITEGSYLAMKNELKIGEGTLLARHGTKLRLYMPSSVTGGSGLVGDGGYEGEYSLDGDRPVIMDVEIVGRINNPVSFEAAIVDGFGLAHGGLSPVREVSDDDDDSAGSGDDGDDEEEEDDGLYWRHACDTILGLIVTKNYLPGQMKFSYDFGYELDSDTDDDGNVLAGTGKRMNNAAYSDGGVYADMSSLEERVNEILVERFGEGSDEGEKVGTSGTAKVWYVTRFLDGFIIDSNIAEIRELVFGPDEASGSVVSYSPESDKDDWVTAWYYSIPGLRYGQWATIVATSTFAYGPSGRSGSTTTTSSGSSYYINPYYNMYNYYNGMYGSSYYDMYYYNMYNYYNNSYYTGTTTETTTISTEIQSYTPLIFQIYIEEK